MTAPSPSGRTYRRKAGFALLAIGLVSLSCGILFECFNVFTTDAEGYSLSEPHRIRTQACAYFIGVPSDPSPQDNALTKWVVAPEHSGKDLFVGWAWWSDAANYTRTFMVDGPKNWDWDYGPYSSVLRFTTDILANNGTRAPPPADQTFWLEQAVIRVGSGSPATIHYDLRWQPRSEMKALVILNLDGSGNVSANVRLGTRMRIFGWLPYLEIPLGVVLIAAGIVLARRR